MDELHAQRRLLKSPPELWAEVSDEEALARHLEPFGQIRITRREPERTVAWEGDRASGTVELDPTGWGTRVTVRATPQGEPARWGDTVSWLAPEEEPWAEEPGAQDARPEPAGAGPEGEEEPRAEEPGAQDARPEPADAGREGEEAAAEALPPAPAPAPAPPRRGFWARLLGRHRPAPPLGPPIPVPRTIEPEREAEPESEPQAEPERRAPAVEVPEVEPEVTRVPPVDRDAARRVLSDMLEHLGTAHHRPYSRG